MRTAVRSAKGRSSNSFAEFGLALLPPQVACASRDESLLFFTYSAALARAAYKALPLADRGLRDER